MKHLHLFIMTLVGIFFWISSARAELIVLAAPPVHEDDYYDEYAEDIAAFHVKFARLILDHGDDVLILSNQQYYDYYVEKVGKAQVLLDPMLDIWMRDFTVQNTAASVMFRYSAAGQGGDQEASDVVQEMFALLMDKAGIVFRETDLINDGGNLVDDYAGNLVFSRKFLRDNDLTEKQARRQISDLTGAKNIAFIEADEQGGLEHADGVVSFIDHNTLAVNDYREDPAYRERLMTDLKTALPGVKIVEVPTPYDGRETVDPRFGSACGLYTNALVTPDRVYLPQFGLSEDRLALEQVRKSTTREVVPVPSGQVCKLGGGVRCMSLQLRGDAAVRLRGYAGQ